MRFFVLYGANVSLILRIKTVGICARARSLKNLAETDKRFIRTERKLLRNPARVLARAQTDHRQQKREMSHHPRALDPTVLWTVRIRPLRLPECARAEFVSRRRSADSKLGDAPWMESLITASARMLPGLMTLWRRGTHHYTSVDGRARGGNSSR